MLTISQPSNAAPPSTLTTDPLHQAAEWEREQPNKASAPPDKGCLRCGGLLVPSYTLPMEQDAAGNPMTVWRCVNCGDCVDHHILFNRRKNSVSARMRARPPTGPQRIGRPRRWKQA